MLGPLPEDDPEFYRNWYMQNVPANLTKYMVDQKDQENEEQDADVNGMVEVYGGDPDNPQLEKRHACDMLEGYTSVIGPND